MELLNYPIYNFISHLSSTLCTFWHRQQPPPSALRSLGQTFNLTKLNATQWMAVAKESGFSRVILTAKHHNGI